LAITPLDIQNKEFERAFRGYDIEDVDEFLDQIAKDLEILISDNAVLTDQLEQMKEKNKNYHKMEGTMHNAIVVAQETAEEVKHIAKREADLIRREAEKDAQRIIDEARYRSTKILSEQEDLFKQAQVFKMRFRSFIEAQLSALESEEWMNNPPKDLGASERKRTFNTDADYEPKSDYRMRSIEETENDTER